VTLKGQRQSQYSEKKKITLSFISRKSKPVSKELTVTETAKEVAE